MIEQDGPGLYLHVPFCVRKCPYCAFYSATDRSLVGDWLGALELEARARAGQGDWPARPRARRRHFDTLYVGGGSPSVLGLRELERLFAIVHAHFAVHPAAEVTFEANPADLTAALCRHLTALGVNRLSLGVQSLDGAVLAQLGRRHDARAARRAMELAREASFGALSVDLIYGVPGQRRASFLRTLERVVAFEPEHLSCYMLTVEPGTPLARSVALGRVRAPSEKLLARRFRETSAWLAEHGYAHDEVSSFSRAPEHRARHNGKYWRHVPYLGLGPAAHSFDGRERFWNVADVGRYVELMRARGSAVEARERLGDEELRLEAIALGLRTAEGIEMAHVRNRATELAPLIGRGWLRRAGNRLVPTREGMLFADRMAVELA